MKVVVVEQQQNEKQEIEIGEMYQVNSNGGLVINDTTYFLNLKESDMNCLGLTYGTEPKIIISQNQIMINDK